MFLFSLVDVVGHNTGNFTILKGEKEVVRGRCERDREEA